MTRAKLARSCGEPSRLTVRAAKPMPGAVHRHAQRVAGPLGGRHGRQHGLLVRHVRLRELPADRGGDLLAGLLVQVGDDDVRPGGGEHARRRLAKAAGAAGDNRRSSIQLHGCEHSSPGWPARGSGSAIMAAQAVYAWPLEGPAEAAAGRPLRSREGPGEDTREPCAAEPRGRPRTATAAARQLGQRAGDRGRRDGRRLRARRDRRRRARRPAGAPPHDTAHRPARPAPARHRPAWRRLGAARGARRGRGRDGRGRPRRFPAAPVEHRRRLPAGAARAGERRRLRRVNGRDRGERPAPAASPARACRARDWPWCSRPTPSRRCSSTPAPPPTPSRRCSCSSATWASRTRRSRSAPRRRRSACSRSARSQARGTRSPGGRTSCWPPSRRAAASPCPSRATSRAAT